MNAREQQNKERDEAFLSLDKNRILAYFEKYDISSKDDDDDDLTEDEKELIFWAGVHKVITTLRSATEEQKMMSRIWLYSHGFRETFG